MLLLRLVLVLAIAAPTRGARTNVSFVSTVKEAGKASEAATVELHDAGKQRTQRDDSGAYDATSSKANFIGCDDWKCDDAKPGFHGYRRGYGYGGPHGYGGYGHYPYPQHHGHYGYGTVTMAAIGDATTGSATTGTEIRCPDLRASSPALPC